MKYKHELLISYDKTQANHPSEIYLIYFIDSHLMMPKESDRHLQLHVLIFTLSLIQIMGRHRDQINLMNIK